MITIKRGKVTLTEVGGLIRVTSGDGSTGLFRADELLDVSCLLMEYQRRRAMSTTAVIPVETVAHLRRLSKDKDKK